MSQKTKIKIESEELTPNNVITFPKSRMMETEITIEQIQENKELIRRIHIEETLEIVIPLMFQTVCDMGFNLSSRPDLQKDISFTADTLNSLLLRYYNIKHPYQDMADERYNLLGEENDGE